jgi:peptide/nickel transport system ATP-binding protein
MSPPIVSATALLEARDIHRSFKVSDRLFRTRLVQAVKGVSLKINRGEIFGLVGESGCGKSTMAQILLGLLQPSSGHVWFDANPIEKLSRRQIASFVQPIFQDPYSSLNPRHTIGWTIGLPLRTHRIADRAETRERTLRMMDQVGLPERFYDRHPNQLSGGQRQRVAIARALIMRPPLLICDEPTSALDVSIQAQVLNLLLDLQKEMKLTMLLISHNLSVVEHMTDKVAVMHKGEIVEESETARLFSSPRHDYTRKLLDAVLLPDIVGPTHDLSSSIGDKQ